MTKPNYRWISWIVLFGAAVLPRASFASNAMTVQGVMRDSAGNLVSNYSPVGGIQAVFHHATQCNGIVNGDANLLGCAPAGGAGSEVIDPFSIVSGAFSVSLTPDSATLAKMATNPTGWSVKLRGVFAPGAPVGEFLIPLNSVPFAKSCELASAVTNAAATGDSIIAAINAGSVQIDAARLPSTIPGVTISGAQVSGTVANATSAVSFSGALSGDVTGTQGATVVTALRGQPISTTAPSSAGQVLQWDGAKWGPAAGGLQGTVGVANGGTGVTSLTGLVKGNGTSAFSAAVSGTDYLEKSGTVTNGKLAMWNGSSQLVDGPDAASANTADALVKRDGSGNFSAGTITATLSGNASTATALAANGSNCAAGQFPLGVDASGNVESCTAPVTSEADTLASVTGRGASTATAVTFGAGATIKGTTNDNSAAALNVTDSLNASKLYVRNDGNVGIGTNSPRVALELGTDGAILATGAQVSGWTEPGIGAGTRMMWYPRKGAFRAGTVSGTQWNDANIGLGSMSLGVNTTASGTNAVALGNTSTASGVQSFAVGTVAQATGANAIALAGNRVTASGASSAAIGTYLTSSATSAFTLGTGVDLDNYLVNNAPNSLAVGFNSTIPTLFVGPSSGIGTTGNVGIGTATPGSLLHLYRAGGSTVETRVENGGALLRAGTNNSDAYITTGFQDSLLIGANGGNSIAIDGVTGKVGIGTTSPRAKLDVAGSVLGPDPYGVVNGTGATSGTPIDFSKGNLQQTSIACTGNTVYLTNLTPGGAYSLLIDAATQSGTCSFEGAGTVSAANPALTFVFQGGVNPAPNTDGRVIYSFMVFGTGTNTAKVYVSLVDNLK